MRLVLLGTASAWPIPRPGCACPQCCEARADPRRRRTRTALRLEDQGEVLIVDPGPDLVHQLERGGHGCAVGRVVVTHTHADHVLGLDDLVSLRGEAASPLPVHAAPFHQARIAAIFPRLVRPGAEKVRLLPWEAGERVRVGRADVEGFETGHVATFPTTAVLVTVPAGVLSACEQRVAVATDMGTLPPASRALLRGVDLLAADASCLGEPCHGHPGTDAVARLAAELGVGRLVLTHVGHVGLADADLRARLGGGVHLASDGEDLLALLA